jgi:arylsulfatase A-like enzyme
MNILLLHAHDLGCGLGCYGAPSHSPCLDALAARAVRFDRAYCAAPTCSPSRAAMLTGQWPHETGMLGLAHRGFRLSHPERHLASYLRASGWFTALCGIQHEFPAGSLLPYDLVAATDGPAESRDRRAADSAIAFFQNSPNQPFFLSCGFFAPHREFPEPGGDAMARSVGCIPAWLPDDPACRTDYAGFLEAVSRMDHEAGRVLDALERSGLAGDTLVVFTTDHGPAFPGAKCQLTEAGLRVAFLLALPGQTERRACPALVSQVDLFPTLCDFLKLPRPDWLRGTSLVPLLNGFADAVREETFAEVSYHAAYEPQRAVITTDAIHARRFHEHARPVFPNIDDSPTKDWFARQPHGFVESPVADPALSERLISWMHGTNDPLISGPVAAPPGARINPADGWSASEPPIES